MANAMPQLNQTEDLAEILQAYSSVTERLQRSHDQLGHEVVRLREELASTNTQLQRSKRLAALGEMAAGIAHEVRNPLAAISLYAQMLQEDIPAQTEPWETAGKIESAVRGLEAVVTDVLTFSQELNPVQSHCRVIELFERAIDLQRPAILNASIVVDDQALDPELMIEADPELIHRAMTNVIRNAIDAMAPDGGTLTLGAAVESGQIVLTIADTGPGIESSQIDRIFNPFFTTRSTGTGLGLAIVHRIIDVHGGSIAVHNKDGAVFVLCLPSDQRSAESLNGVTT